MSSDKERLATLEANISYIKDEVVFIRKDVRDLVGWKLKLAGAASVIAGIVAYVTAILVH